MQVRKDSWRIACAAMVLGVCFAGVASAQQFRLIAGGDGDGGSALQANLAGAGDAVYDSAGNLYVAQRSANRIRKITPAGKITTLVGGNVGFAGDGGPASAAKINQPVGLEIDAAGNLYFGDFGNRRVRRISTSGIITTIAGNGTRASTGNGGPATAAAFKSIDGLAMDASGNLFVSEGSGNLIRKITPGGVISIYAGNGTNAARTDSVPATSTGVYFPLGIDVDAAGNLYIAEFGHDMVRKVTPGGMISTLIMPMVGFTPRNVAVSPDGRILVAGYRECLLTRMDTTGQRFFAAGSGSCGDGIDGGNAFATPMGSIDGIAFDPQGRTVVVDIHNGKVRRISDGTSEATMVTIAGMGGKYTNGMPALGAPLGALNSIARDLAGNLLITDAGYRRVRRISSRGTIETLAGTGFSGNCPEEATACAASAYGFSEPWGIAPGNAAGQVLVAGDNRLNSIASNGTVSLIAGGLGHYALEGPASGTSMQPFGIVRAPNGDLLIADTRENIVRRLRAGMLTRVAGTGTYGSTGDGGAATNATLASPHAIALDAAGNIYVSESSGKRVRKIDTKGIITRIAGIGSDGNSGDGGAAVNASVGVVTGIAVRGTDIYLASDGGALRKIDARGIITTIPLTVQASGLLVDGDSLYLSTQEGRLYVASFAPRKVEHDYDGDGRSDILWRSTTSGANTIWKSANGAATQPVTGVTSQAWKVQGQGDFDGDGRDDIFWRNVQTGANTAWRSGNGATSITATGITDVAWAVVGVGDFNKDGRSDLVWRNKATGANAIWTTLTGAGLAVAKFADQQWQIVAVGDFDGDLVADLFWRNASTGANQVWRGGNNLAQLAVATAPPAWKLQAVGDFDGDGRSDVFFRNATTGQDVIWNSANAGTARTLTTVTSPQWKVVAAGDYDGDGKDDLLWRNATTGANTIWKAGNGATLQTVTGVTGAAWTVVPYSNQP